MMSLLPRFQFRIASLFVAITAIGIVLGLGPWLFACWNTGLLDNSDLKVDGTGVGLLVRIDSPAAKRLRLCGPRANACLLAALRDPNRFAAAHVLLTDMNAQVVQSDAAYWNSMRITLYSDGTADFHPEQAEKLAKHWATKLSAGNR